MTSITGCLLVPGPKNDSDSLWFIFHHEEDGILAFDLTKDHPDVPYKRFETVLDSEDNKAEEDKIVHLGGPLQSDSALIILHNMPQANDESHIINDDFSFLSYRYVLVPGKPPSVAKSDNSPTRIDLGPAADFIVAVGFRLWEMDDLEEELKNWQWTILPATPELIFHTSRADRLQKAKRSIN